MKHSQPPKFILEELEPRILLNADPTLVSAAGGGMAGSMTQVTETGLVPGGGLTGQAEACRREVAFIDGNIGNHRQLAEDLSARQDGGEALAIVVLDPGGDGVAQISSYLEQQQQGLDAVHIFAHGGRDGMALGNVRLGADTIDAYASQIGDWRRALSPGADMLLYGCGLASGESGQAFVDRLAGLTGADIAASDDLTGDARRGADWDLEHQRGDIETEVAFSTAPGRHWTGVLATFTVDTTADTVDNNLNDGVAKDASNKTSLRAAIMQANHNPDPDTIVLGPETYTLTRGPAGDYDGLHGDLDIHTDITITGADKNSTVIDMNGIDRVFHIQEDIAHLTLTDLTVRGGSTGDKGGGVFVAQYESRFTASRVIITGNIAADGAGIFNEGTMTLTDVEISSNGDISTDEGGGIYTERIGNLTRVTISGNDANRGGGIFTDNNGDLFLTDVTLHGNTAADMGGGLYHKDGTADLNSVTISANQANRGGGIYNDSPDDLFLTNVTLSGNTATDTGGGLHSQRDASILNSTFTSNTANNGGGIYRSGGTVTLRNTIVAGNQANASNPDVSGSFSSLGHNLIGNATGASGFIGSDITGNDIASVDARLGLLADNGGFSETHALQAGSPAIDPAGLSGAPAVDQRGTARDGTPDIGAFEVTTGNAAPTADASAGEPYAINEGEPVTLDGTGSSDPDGDTLTYAWDLNNDGTYGDVTGASPTVDWTTLKAFGIDDDGVYPIGLRVEDGSLHQATAATTLAVSNTAPVITVAGPASVDEDAVYTLDLTSADPGADTITWTVNWGDGEITTHASTGAVTSVTHTYLQSGFTRSITVSARDEDGYWTNSDLLVGSFTIGGNKIFRFDGQTGASAAAFDVSADLSGPIQAVVGPDGKYYVSGSWSNKIVRYDADGTNPVLFTDHANLNMPNGMVFGPDGHLYVSNSGANNILKFNVATGVMDIFGGGGPLNGPGGLIFGPDGDLYISSANNNRIVKLDGDGPNGQIPVTVISTGLLWPEQLAFDAAGDLYISNRGTSQVKRWDGASVTTYFSHGSLSFATGLSFGPDGKLYVSSFFNNTILRYDGVAGEVFAVRGPENLDQPEYLSFTPDHQVLVNHRAGTPTVSGAVTDEDTLSSSGLVIDRHADDGTEVTHFKITNITNGTLYRNDGTTVIGDGDFIPYAEGNLGLKFMPGTDFHGLASFDVQASTTGDDTDLSTVVTAAITVNSINDPPAFGSTPVTSATEGAAYTYTATATDLDGDTLTMSAGPLPAWLSFNPATGVLSGTPANADVGDHPIVLSVTDSTVSVDQSFTITVADINNPPAFGSTPVTSATEGAAYTYIATATDLDGDTLTMSAGPLPAWLSFNPATGVLSGTPANTDVGDHPIVLSVTDSTVSVDQSFTITVADINNPPAFGSTPVTSATEGAAYTYTATATDLDGDTLTMSAGPLPAWLSFNPATGVLSGTPANADVGDHPIVLSVTDSTVSADQSFTITVADINNPPAFGSTPVTSATEGAAYTYTATATDLDDDTLTMSAGPLPAWLSFNPATGVLSGTPANADVGDHPIVLSVTDSTVSVDQSFTITVADINNPPAFGSTPVTSATEGAAYTYTATATDLDGDTLTMSAGPLPAWLSFNPATGVLSGTPANADVGDHPIVLSATDGTVSVDQGFTITVANTNNPPAFGSSAVTNATEGSAYAYTFTASDPDAGDTLTLSAPTLPNWLSFNPATGVLSGTPTNAHVGDHAVVLRVTDGTVSVDQGFTITVANTNNPPTVTSAAVTNATEGSAYAYTFTVSDPDAGDTLTLSAPTLPGWLSFNPATGVLSGTPTNAHVGDHAVVLRASDGTVSVDQNFTITVAGINNAPTITSTAVTNATEGSAYSYTFTASDPDAGDTLTLSAPTLPNWLSFNPATGVLSGTPTNAHVGDHAVILRASDGTVSVDQGFTVTVANTNNAPTITSTAVTNATEGTAYTYTFTASDPDAGDTLTLSAPALPGWLSFNPATGVLSGTPANAHVGDHAVVLRASDGTVSVDQSFTVTVTVADINTPPVAVMDRLHATEDHSLLITPVTDLLGNDTDADGDTLSLTNISQPSRGRMIHNADGTLTYLPEDDFSGVDQFTYSVSDGRGGVATGTAMILVAPVGDTPQIINEGAPSGDGPGQIFIIPHAGDGPEVTHFRISGITNGTLFLADGVTRIVDGDYITVQQGRDGLIFVPDPGSTADGSLAAESSEDGVSVARQSQAATTRIPFQGTERPEPPAYQRQNRPAATGIEPAAAAVHRTQPPAQTTAALEAVKAAPEKIEAADEPQTTEPSRSSTGISSESDASSGSQAADTGNGVRPPSDGPDMAGSEDDKDEFAPQDRALFYHRQARQMPTKSFHPAGPSTAAKTLDIRALTPQEYDFVRNALKDFRNEISNEIRLSRTLLGSAMATSVGLSAGYVIWMLKGGSLLASVLSSIPAWQLTDPLAILAGKKGMADDDDESLENIIDDAPARTPEKASEETNNANKSRHDATAERRASE